MANIIYEELSNQGFFYMRPFFINEAGDKLEIHVTESMKEIRLSYIKVQERRQGHGTTIMNFLTDLADKAEYTITLTVDSSQGTPKKVLRKFYQKFGFKESTIIKDSYKRIPKKHDDTDNPMTKVFN